MRPAGPLRDRPRRGGMFGLAERTLVSQGEMNERARLLESRGLSVPGGEGVVIGLYSGERLVATGSLIGDILQGIAVEKSFEGEGAAAAVTTALIKKGVELGRRRLFLYSSPEEARRFEALGFSLLATAVARSSGLGAALLEWGPDNADKWKESALAASEGKPGEAGIVVVNCNPFTLGHYSLLERAAARAKWLYALVVQEDRSLFPFDVRLRLVREGVSGLSNVTVLPGGPYVISAATFPTYFTRIEAEEDVRLVELYASLDVELFGRLIAPAFRASDRFVGTEPYCPVTSVYNRVMKERLPLGGEDWPPVAVHELPRLEMRGEAVSASRVREYIREGDMEAVFRLVPGTTRAWLESEEAGPVIEKIRYGTSRH